MPTIDQLSSTTTLTTSDKLVVYSQDNGDTRKTTLSTLLDFLHANFQEEGLLTQVTVPSTGQNIIVGPQTQNLWLVLNPAGGLASLTVTLPPSTSTFDGQEVSISTSQGITTFTLAGNGATVLGSPSSLAANAFFTLKYNITQNSWYSTNQGVPNSFGTITITNGINDANNNELVKFTATASAVNEVTITNAATGNDPSIAATGDNANIDLNLLGKGSGTVHVAGVPVVTTTGTQTLTNKTLSAPTFSGATTGSVFPAADGTQPLGTNGARWDAYTKNITTNIATFKTPDPVDSKTTARTNEIVQRNVPKAWGLASGSGAGGILFTDGFNVASIAYNGGAARVTFATPMADGNYMVVVSSNGAGVGGATPTNYVFEVTNKEATRFNISALNTGTQALVDLGSVTASFGFVVFGLQ